MAHDGSPAPSRGSLRKLLWIGLLVFIALLAGVATVAWLLGDTQLTNEYEGFD
jgi:hypothetical protein